ncbi:hypothetical protein B0H19DRAFT_1062689 [Mycena capillaripes]|nr:hypothetical protein B0H19DRAFT_1062689 [Mycena capillaripes]
MCARAAQHLSEQIRILVDEGACETTVRANGTVRTSDKRNEREEAAQTVHTIPGRHRCLGDMVDGRAHGLLPDEKRRGRITRKSPLRFDASPGSNGSIRAGQACPNDRASMYDYNGYLRDTPVCTVDTASKSKEARTYMRREQGTTTHHLDHSTTIRGHFGHEISMDGHHVTVELAAGLLALDVAIHKWVVQARADPKIPGSEVMCWTRGRDDGLTQGLVKVGEVHRLARKIALPELTFSLVLYLSVLVSSRANKGDMWVGSSADKDDPHVRLHADKDNACVGLPTDKEATQGAGRAPAQAIHVERGRDVTKGFVKCHTHMRTTCVGSIRFSHAASFAPSVCLGVGVKSLDRRPLPKLGIRDFTQNSKGATFISSSRGAK